MAQRFVSGGESGVDYAFQGGLFDMRSKDHEAFVETFRGYAISLESSSMSRGLADPEDTIDMWFDIQGSIENLWVLATTSPIDLTYEDVVGSGIVIPRKTRQYVYGELVPGTSYYGWIACLGSLGETFVSKLNPFAGTSTIDTSPPIVANAKISLRGPDIKMTWSVSDNKKVTTTYILRTTDPAVKSNFQIITDGIQIDALTTSYTWTARVDGTHYYVWLTCRDEAGNYVIVRTTLAL